MKTIAQQLNVKEFPFVIKNKDGNEIYREYSNGYWWKQEFDSAGKQIYAEDSAGSWYKREYDSNGNEIYYEDSSGSWYKQEYDSNGNEIYWENCNGVIVDKRPKNPCDGKEIIIEGKKYKLKEVK